MATHDGLLYVVGGVDGVLKLNAVEVYNPTTNSWSLFTAYMGIPLGRVAVSVINRPF